MRNDHFDILRASDDKNDDSRLEQDDKFTVNQGAFGKSHFHLQEMIKLGISTPRSILRTTDCCWRNIGCITDQSNVHRQLWSR